MAAFLPSVDIAARSTPPAVPARHGDDAAPHPLPYPESNTMPTLPLSDATISTAHRQSADTAPAQPPVIHVTIDRIDIRAPGAAARPASPARTPRHAAPSQSLADYLRGRPRGVGGSS